MRIIAADLIKFETKILLISKFMVGFMLSLCLIFHLIYLYNVILIKNMYASISVILSDQLRFTTLAINQFNMNEVHFLIP